MSSRLSPSFALPSSLLVPLLLAALCPFLASAQTVKVQNGGTFQVSGGTVGLEGGTMDLGGVGVTARLEEQSQGHVTGGELKATRSLNSPSSVDVAGLGAELSASVDLGDVAVTRGHTIQTDGSGNESIKRYYDISPSKNNSGLSATLTHHYSDGELNGLSESGLELFRSTDGGSTWEEKGYDSRDASANTVTLSGISSFSRWTLGSESSPLPVELVSFEGTRTEESEVTLKWQTASEEGNGGFEVQHKQEEGDTWSKLGFVESKAEGGITTEPTSYSYGVEDLGVGTHQFRLKQVDVDGTSHAHDPIRLKLTMQERSQLSAPAPNPVSGTAAVSFAVKEETEASITLYNVLGQKVATLYEGTPQAEEEQILQIDTSDLASGVYVMRLEVKGQVQTQRVTVVR